MKKMIRLMMAGLILAGCQNERSTWYQFDDQSEPRWYSFENITAAKGAGGQENNTAKGHPSEPIKAGASVTLLDMSGPGLIQRMWMTINDRSEYMLRALKIEIFWDNQEKPAVAVPFGDFFGVGLGRTAVYENSLFANPEGRSFNCFIPMPFKKHARVVITNESDRDLAMLFFDINVIKKTVWNTNNLYFHAFWQRDTATGLAEDYEILPKVVGRGRFLGTNIGVFDHPRYAQTWFGEGEIKMFLEGDVNYPTLNGTGTEDYIGTGWGQGTYALQYSGCLIGDTSKMHWCFYRYHIPDPIYFKKDIRVTLQQIGSGPKAVVLRLQNEGVPLIPVTIVNGAKLEFLYTPGQVKDLDDPGLPDAWTNYYRSDDVSAVAYFYLDQPQNTLPDIPPVELRTSKTTR